jgi:hypothetical protein
MAGTEGDTGDCDDYRAFETRGCDGALLSMPSMNAWRIRRDLTRAIIRATAAAGEGETLAAEAQLVSEMLGQDVSWHFQRLASVWREETVYFSDIAKICNHPAYNSIIAMGWPVVPMLLRELEIGPDYWFSALCKITGENPVAPEMAGRLKDMAAAWIDWGREHGISW